MRKNLPRISVVVPTRSRPGDLKELLQCLYRQRRSPFQIIIVDSSPMGSAKIAIESFRSIFKSRGCRFTYVKGGYDGLPAARNLGVRYVKGEAVLFLDDDTLPDENVIDSIAYFLSANPFALGLQPKVERLGSQHKRTFIQMLWNAISTALMLSYSKQNQMGVRRSVERIMPGILTKEISAQALTGCGCYRREIFRRFSFDTRLKRWGYLEDLDFSYRVYREFPDSLYAIPGAMVLHKASPEARLPTKEAINMSTVYRFYVFFKDFSNESMLNLPAFLWAQVGRLVKEILKLARKQRPTESSWELIYLIRSYLLALRNLKAIKSADLGFFNTQLLATN